MTLVGAHPTDSRAKLKETPLTRKFVNQLVEDIAKRVEQSGPTPLRVIAEEIRFFFGEYIHHGVCSVCERIYRLRRDELVQQHRPRRGGPRCPGGLKAPARYTGKQRNRDPQSGQRGPALRVRKRGEPKGELPAGPAPAAEETGE